jgi:hypothetical protein
MAKREKWIFFQKRKNFGIRGKHCLELGAKNLLFIGILLYIIRI